MCGTLAVYRDDLVALKYDAASAVGPLLRLLDPEQAHNIGIWAASKGLFPRETRPDDGSLRITCWGKQFRSPLGLSAGFDKDGVAAASLLDLGFAFVEVGSITPEPQPGNPKPRCFRVEIPGQECVINRYGFNNVGADRARENLVRQRELMRGGGGVIGINIGKNKTSEDAVADYVIGVRKLGPLADYLVVNISSPNTPGLRSLQSRSQLETLIKAVVKERDQLEGNRPPVLVKIALDLVDEELKDIARVATSLKLDGLIVSNTTIERPPAIQSHIHGHETGGLSGKPLFAKSTEVLHRMYALTKGKIVLVGVGGVSSGEDAYKKIRAGATLVELYTALSYEGPSLVPRVKRELAACLARDGFTSVADAVGADHRR